MKIPDQLLYTKDHEWLRIEGNEGFIGITDFAQGELGDVVFIEVDTIGETIGKGETFGTIEAVKTVSDMFMPIAGEILEVNPVLENAPETINKDPYGDGWVVRIKISDMAETEELLTAEKYLELIGA